MKRRDFHKVTMAAFGGLVAGTAANAIQADAQDDEEPMLNVDPGLLLREPHICRGLNTCKGKGKGKGNKCAGQGACATAEAHDCATLNSCKGDGGCGGYPGQNTCKGKGNCAMPPSDEAWELARMQFSELMANTGKEVGDPPKKKGDSPKKK